MYDGIGKIGKNQGPFRIKKFQYFWAKPWAKTRLGLLTNQKSANQDKKLMLDKNYVRTKVMLNRTKIIVGQRLIHTGQKQTKNKKCST